MPTDNDKRAAQTAFLSAQNIKDLYQQIVSEGHISMGGKSLIQQITHDILSEIEPPDKERDMGLEPER